MTYSHSRELHGVCTGGKFSMGGPLKILLLSYTESARIVSGIVNINTLVNITAYNVKTKRNFLNSYILVMTKVGEITLG